MAADFIKPEVIAAGLSALATIAAAVAAFRAPISAAAAAEALRSESAQAQHRRQIKLSVFGAIMQERADIAQRDCVIALNLIDVAFFDVPHVREAWAELHESFSPIKQVPTHIQDERLRKLLRAMAQDLGLADNLRLDDFARIYYPNALADETRALRLQQQDAIRRLTQKPEEPARPSKSTTDAVADQAAEQKVPVLDGWPPRPTANG